MLETRRVVAYGKRPRRIVYVSNDTQSTQYASLEKDHITRENTTSLSPASARKWLSRGRKVHGLSTSPRGSPKSGNIFGLASKKVPGNAPEPTPRRKPLGLKNVALSTSPSVVYLDQRPAQISNAKMPAFSPFVDSVIIVTDKESGGEVQKPPRKVSRGKMSHLKDQIHDKVEDLEREIVRPSRRRAFKQTIVVSDDEDSEGQDIVTIVRRPKRGAKANPILISDESDDGRDKDPRPLHPTGTEPPAVFEQSQPLPKRPPRQVPIPRHRITSGSKPHCVHGSGYPVSVLPKPGPFHRRSDREVMYLSKTRARQFSSSTLDLERSFAALSISADVQPDLPPSRTISYTPSDASVSTPQHLIPFLTECAQAMPYCFSAFIDTFPFDELHGSARAAGLAFRKIGEASFSEVFAIGEVVIKIVPLRDESCADLQRDGDVDLPQESDTKDVLQEVIVTRAMGQICPGFIKLLRTYVVVGEYPSLLLSLWDEFDIAKSSENIRPGVFPPAQAYALLVLPNGGPDLEAYPFPLRAGWRQACSIFWQTAKGLAIAEDLVSFEHRDLHWGQILVKSTDHVRKIMPRQQKRRADANADKPNANIPGIPMDHPSHGVTATIIDLGLARMNAQDGNGNDVHYTPFDDVIFEGEGDYQFDVYRMMRRVLGDGAWKSYCPLTNVMWLHYLTLKLLHSKRIRPPGARAAAVAGEFNEKQCYDCLVEMERLLKSCIIQSKGKKSRGLGGKGPFSRAGDVVIFARERGWLE